MRTGYRVLPRVRAAEPLMVRDANLARIVFGSALLILFLLSMAIATRGHDPEYAAVAAAEGYGVSQSQ
jgi:hypothetical protein